MLPVELQAAVHEIERLAGCEISVVPDSAANEFDSLMFGVEAGLCRATIAYPGNSISRCAILHELLHLKRYWLDAVPILRPTASLYQSEAQWLEDFIEHLIIIPEERRFAETESNAHWSAVLGTELARLSRVSTRSSQAEVITLHRNLLLQRAMMDIALPGLDHTGLYDRLRDENFFEASAAFVDRLRNMLRDKKSALIFACREFRYDLSAFCVGTFNIRATPKSFLRSDSLAHTS